MAKPFYEQKPKSLRVYIIDKINMLEDEFLIRLTDSEIKHFKGLRTEEDVDRYAHQIIVDRL